MDIIDLSGWVYLLVLLVVFIIGYFLPDKKEDFDKDKDKKQRRRKKGGGRMVLYGGIFHGPFSKR